MAIPLPPNLKQSTIDSLPARHREDAIQEAWVAYLSGKSPAAAATNYVKREKKLERREKPFSKLDEQEQTQVEEVLGESINATYRQNKRGSTDSAAQEQGNSPADTGALGI